MNNLLSSVWIALAIGTIAAAVAGLLVGWLAVRRIGIYFAMITLAFGQMAFFLENNPLSAFTGGENGLSGVPEPTLGFGDWAERIRPGLPMYWLLAAFFFASFLLARRIVHSPFGVVLRAIKENTARAAMLGHAVPRYKLAVFIIAAAFAGLAGGLLGVLQSFMPPDAFMLDTSGQLVAQTVIGGVGTLIGPAVGAAVWLWLRDNLQLIPGVGPLWKLILGLVFVVLVTALRRGICGEIRIPVGSSAAGVDICHYCRCAVDHRSTACRASHSGTSRLPGTRNARSGAALRRPARRRWGVVRGA